MRFSVRVPADVQAFIAALPPLRKQSIRAGLDLLSEDPLQGKPLGQNLSGLYSLRVNRYRIIYEIHRKIVTVQVIAIGHRESIYSRTKNS